MRVQLAYPYQGHRPDEVISVDDRTGRRLLREGRVRPAPELEPADEAREQETDDETPAEAGRKSEVE